MSLTSLLASAIILSFSAENASSGQKKPITSVGIYLDVPDYSQSAFALMEEAEDAMEEAFPGLAWLTIDSSDTKARKLPYALPALGRLAKNAPDSQAVTMGAATCKIYECSHLLLIQPGGHRAARDSSPEFADKASFTLIEASTGRPRFKHHLASNQGTKTSKLSAESAWAQNAWAGFVKAWKADTSR